MHESSGLEYASEDADIIDTVIDEIQVSSAEDVPFMPVVVDRRQNSNEEQDVVDECETANEAPEGGWGWMIVLGSFLVHIVSGGFERANGVMFLQLLTKYKKSATATAWVPSIFSALRLLLGPLASALCNKYSCRAVVMLGAICSSVGMLITAYVPALPYLYITYGVLGGVGRAFAYTPSLIIVGYYFNKKRGIAIGLSTSGVGVGSFLFPPIFDLLFQYYGFPGTCLILSAVMSQFFICGCLFRSIERHTRIIEYDRVVAQGLSTRHCGTNDKLLSSVSMATDALNPREIQTAVILRSSIDVPTDADIKAKGLPSLQRRVSQVKYTLRGSNSKRQEKKPLLELHLFRNYAFCALCVQLFLFTISYNSTFVFLPALAKEKGVTHVEGAYLVSILGIFDGISRIVMSSVLDLKKVKPFRLWIYNFVMFLAAIVSMLIPSMNSFSEFAIISAFYGVLSGTYISQKSVVVVDVLGVEKLSSSFGLLMLCQGISGVVGPTVGGLFKDFLGTYSMAFYFGSLGIVAGGLIMASGNIWLHWQKKRIQ